MDFIQEYQEFCRLTAIYDPSRGVEYCILGLVGEAGELANKFKKVIRDDYGHMTLDKRNDLLSELGDVCWYVARLAHELGYSMETVMQHNMDKLKDRYERNQLGGSGDNR